MYRGTKDIKLPTTITGSLPRPSWYTENLGTRHFLEAMVSRRFREQYEDALTCYLRDQELAGLDIVTDGDCRFDDDVGGQSWTAYPPNHMSGLDARIPSRRRPAAAASCFRAATFCMTIWNCASCRSSPARSGAAICNTPRCGRRRSASPRSRSNSARCRRRSSPSRCRTATTRACPTACSRSPTPSTRNITSWPTPAAR